VSPSAGPDAVQKRKSTASGFDVDIHGWITLKWILKKHGVKVWTVFSGGLL
jgi:hypothetical protein